MRRGNGGGGGGMEGGEGDEVGSEGVKVRRASKSRSETSLKEVVKKENSVAHNKKHDTTTTQQKTFRVTHLLTA